jgi:hypothetical protein
MSEMSESLDKKSFFTLISYLAEGATDDIMMKHFANVLRRYEKAKLQNKPQVQLDIIFNEMKILCYVTMLKTLNRSAEELIKNMDDIDRVLNLITPTQN